MFLNKYVNNFYYNQIINNYEEEFIKSLNEDNFKKIYDLFISFNFYFVDDIILDYLEIFAMNPEYVKKKLLELKDKLGDRFNYIIGNDMTYLNSLIS
jgi:hypothetical protein